MKLLFCQDCGDIIAPFQDNRKVRFCVCRRHAIWWENSRTGVLRVCDTKGRLDSESLIGHPWAGQERAYVIGLTNTLLAYPFKIEAKDVQDIIDSHDDYYLFKRIRSMVIRIRPGESSDTAWAALPEPEAES